MKVAYFGESNSLSLSILERLHKEEHDVYFISSKAIEKEYKQLKKYHHYMVDGNQENMERILKAIVPQVIIYEGNDYLLPEWDIQENNNLSLLSSLLEQCKDFKDITFVLLSSIEVYGQSAEKITEETIPGPCNTKGMWMLQQERIAQMYQEQRGMNTVIFRLAPIFTNEIQIGSLDLLGQLGKKMVTKEEVTITQKWMQPIHVSDVADALVRVLESGKTTIYNVCGSEKISNVEIAQGILSVLDIEKEFLVEETGENVCFYSNHKLKREQEWVEFWSLKEMLINRTISLSDKQKEEAKQAKPKKSMEVKIRAILENLAIFAVLCTLYCLTLDHALFSKVDWLLMYVVVVSLFYGVKQGTVAVVLSSAVYLISQGKNILEMTNFYSYIEGILVIVEFLFFGIVVGYVVELLRSESRASKKELMQLKVVHEELKEINDKNVLLKNEYERRILESKNSLPYLYSIMNKINVLDSNRILMEILHIVEDLLKTNTVAVYRVSEKSSYLRLVVSLNKESIVEGNSWNLKDFPAIETALRQKQIYEGNIWKKEPAIVVPLLLSDVCTAAIVIKELPLESHSLNSINLLRMILLLASDSIEKAFQYDSMIREKKYVKDTNILLPDEFMKAVNLVREQKEKAMAESCLIKIKNAEDIVEVYHKSEKIFREIDTWGIDKTNNLYVLLGNTSDKDAHIVLDRLEKHGIIAEKIDDIG